MTNYIRAFWFLERMKRRAYWSRAKLKNYQDIRIRNIVRYAYENSPFYHEKWKNAGVRPNDVQSVEDLRKLPIVRKKDLANNLADIVSREFKVSDLKVHRTSGSTGQPLYVYLTQAENEFRKAKHLRSHILLGQKPWDKWITITSPLHFAETTRLQRIFRYYSVIPISVFDDVSAQISKISNLKPDIIDGYFNSLLLLAKEMQKRGVRDVKPKFLVSGAELIDVHARSFIEDFFGAPLFDQYATVEFERIAWQCRVKGGYHVDADSVVVEFVDECGEAVADGESGEIVCTSLFNYAMPFIRYALDDVGVPCRDDECECGITFPMMKVVEGRKTSFLTFSTGRILAPFAFMLALWTFEYYDFIDLFRIVQTDLDKLVFKIKPKAELPKEFEKKLIEHVRKELALEKKVDIVVEFVNEIPLDKTGKFRIIVSEVM
ncbi:MAG: hypothetical protein QXJ94_04470 [Candidatus Bathyarchaeia archaeon]